MEELPARPEDREDFPPNGARKQKGRGDGTNPLGRGDRDRRDRAGCLHLTKSCGFDEINADRVEMLLEQV